MVNIKKTLEARKSNATAATPFLDGGISHAGEAPKKTSLHNLQINSRAKLLSLKPMSWARIVDCKHAWGAD
jgi:hypothetical protein